MGSSYRLPIKVSKGSQLESPTSKRSLLESPPKSQWGTPAEVEEKSALLEEKDYYDKLKALKADQVLSS